MGAVAPLRLIQLGKETTRGTEVAATARLLTRPGGVTWRDLTEKAPVEADFGQLDLRHSDSLSAIVRNSSELELSADLSFEQILYPLLAGVRGAVSPGAEQTVSQGDFLWTFTPLASADPAPDAFTLEYVEREGATNRQEITATFGLCRRLRVAASQGAEQATLEAEFFARKSVSQAPTASIGLPTRNIVPGPKFTVKTASTFAGLSSGSLLTAQVISLEWELVTGILPKFRLDAASVDFAGYQFGIREMSLSLVLDLTAEAETERTAGLQAESVRYLRCEVEGAQIGTGLNRRITIDGAYEITDPIESGSDQDGQSSVDIAYKGIFDATKGAAFEITVVNTLSAIP